MRCYLKKQVNYSNPMSQTIKIAVNTDTGVIEFDKLPANLSYAIDEEQGYVVSDNAEDMTREIENLSSISHQIVDSAPYHEKAIVSYEEMLIKINPRLAKQKEQEDKIKHLEDKVGNIESGISDMRSMMVELLKQQKQ